MQSYGDLTYTQLIITSLLTYTPVDMAETYTNIFSMKQRFHKYIFHLPILLLKRRKFAIFNHVQTNARFE